MNWEILRWQKAIAQNGLWTTVKNRVRMGDLKHGNLVGTDSLGNKYYQNLEETVLGRDRWVEYAHRGRPSDASYVAPEWHAWIHKMSDVPPSSSNASQYYANVPANFVWREHKHNLTGTSMAYRPYPTVKPKIAAWINAKPQSRQ